MNVLIVEMGGSHIECIYTFVHFLKLEKHNVHLACNKKLLPLFPEKEQLSGVITLPDVFTKFTSLQTFLAIRRYIKKNGIDTLILNTTEIKLARNLTFFIPHGTNCIGVVHNAKKLEKSFTYTKIFTRKMKKFFVLGNNLLKHLHPDPVFKVATFFPVYFPTFKQRVTKPKGDFWVTIAGEAEEHRRDYKALINELEQANIDASVKFIFLGKYKLDDRVPAAVKETAWWQQHIICFNDIVGYDTFHSYISQTDILLPLIKLHNDNVYNTSRISGSFNLGFGYKKPFLLPQALADNNDLRPYSFYYSSMPELFQLIGTLVVTPGEMDDIKEAYAYGRFNDIDSMAKEVCSFIFKPAK